MRRSVVFIVLFWAMGLNALAQTQGIMFEPTRSWKKIVEKARSENKLIFVDCYADWCGPCKMMSPIIDEIAEELQESIKV